MKKITLIIFLLIFSFGYSQDPSVGPANPVARNAWDVKSLYGDMYTNESGVAFATWAANMVGDITLDDGNVVKKFTSYLYSGIQEGTGDLDVSAMPTLHIDLYSPGFTAFSLKLEDTSGHARELDVPGTRIQSGWNSYDIDLSTYASVVDLAHLRWIVPVTWTPPGETVYIDNVYFFRPATSSTPTAPSNLSYGGTQSFIINQAITAVMPTVSGNPAPTFTINPALPAGLSLNSTTGVISGTPSALSTSTDYTVTATNTEGSTTATVNITVVVAPILPAAPTPTARNSGDVVSLFSSAYTDIPGTDFRPDWGQSTGLAKPLFSGDEVLEYSNLNYEGIAPATSINGSTFNKIHIDIWSTNVASLRFVPISNTPFDDNKGIILTLVPNQWNSFDIDLTSATFAGLGIADIFQFKIDQPATVGGTIDIDNFYFYREASSDTAPSNLSYGGTKTFIINQAITGVTPTVSGSPVPTFGINPALPAGLNFNSATGEITGTPTALSVATDYVVTATNSVGSIAVNVNIAVVVTPALPVVPTPLVRNSSDVKSLYSDSYANEPGVFFPGWGATTEADVTFDDGNVVKKYANHNLSGIQAGTGDLDVSAMTKMHIDVYSPDFTSFRVKLEEVSGTAVDLEVPAAKAQGAWNSYDLDLSTYSGVDLTHLRWVVLYSDNASLYFDNVYFYKESVSSAPSDLTYGGAQNFTINQAITAVTPTVTGNPAPTFTVNPTLPVGLNLDMTTGTISGTPTALSAATDYTVTATNSAGSTTATLNIAVVAASVNPAAPTPPARNSGDVVSLFSGAYADVSGTDFRPEWGQSTALTRPLFGGDEVLEYSNLNYEGIVPSAHINGSNFNKIHLDIWSADVASIRFVPISNTPFDDNKGITLTLVPNQWNSFDIDLTSATFAGLGIADIYQFKIDQPATVGGTIDIDNFYFYRDASVTPISPSDLTYGSAKSFLINEAITVVTPTVTGNPAPTFTVNPTLPAGLNLDITTGTISGTPTALSAATDYTVTVTNSAGSTTATVNIVVVAAPVHPAAPTPPARNSGDVISLFSGAYADVSGTDFRPGWGQTTVLTRPLFGGDEVLEYSNLNYEGIVPSAHINGSNFNKIHLDIWSADVASIRFVPISNTPFDDNKGITLTLVPNQWNSFDIDLTSATFAGLGIVDIYQFKIDQPAIVGGTIDIDNFYFYRDALVTPISPSDLTYGGAKSYIVNEAITVVTPTVTGNPAPTFTVNPTLPAGLNLDITTGTISGTPTALSATTDYTVTATNSAGSTTATVNIVVVAAPVHPAAPTPPARNSGDVISLFSGAYADVSGTDFRPGWGQTTVLTRPLFGGDEVLEYSNLNYEGIVPSAHINGSNFNKIHLDIWSADVASIRFVPISNTPFDDNKGITLTLVPNQWNSFDIDLTSATFAGLGIADIYQFKIDQPATVGGTIDIDNFYFYRSATSTVAPTFGAFTIPQKIVGDASFQIVSPISNSTGAFTYSSSNVAVATVSGNMITIVGAGDSIITANQAADANYTAGSTTATFSVNAAVTTEAPSNLSYGSSKTFIINQAISTVTPTVSGNPVPTFEINPTLPEGLSFNTTTGVITGTPTALSSATDYTVTATNSAGSTTAIVSIQVSNDGHDSGVLKIAQGFSPNGDSINDFWIIGNIESHPFTKVSVYNKNGGEVYNSSNYQNDWNGEYKNTGKIVAAGSYFYQIDLNGDGSIDNQGWIYIAN
ncbi:putative Ig domain-containing protein [Flavobacterium sp. 5]|uniref:putative Ig domain-containing protein n=1 Tax=Flavobacterium sp. 5 TaxID=2035199 RepID=UPI000C2BCAC6|nr:putative Ig domain-containing protein [Flavobacterium sp. 5]PKB15170.1 gliding motility-associated-like protein [Flavobacterium sp. 5]